MCELGCHWLERFEYQEEVEEVPRETVILDS